MAARQPRTGGEAAADTPDVDADEDDPRKLLVQLGMAKKGEDDERGVSHNDLEYFLVEHGLELEEARREIDRALREGRLQEPVKERYEVTL